MLYTRNGAQGLIGDKSQVYVLILECQGIIKEVTPMRSNRAKGPDKVTAVLVGPCHNSSIGGYVDRDYRHVALDLNIRPHDGSLLSSDVRFHLEVHRSRYGDGRWSEPFISPVEFQTYGFHLNLEYAEHAVKHLKAVRRYIERLPVRPQTFGDLVAVIGQLHHIGQMGQLELFAYENHAAPSPEGMFVSLPRLVHLAQERYDRLAAEE